MITFIITYRQTMDDDRPLALLDDVGQHAQRRGNRLVIDRASRRCVDVDVCVGAGHPVDVRGVDCILNL